MINNYIENYNISLKDVLKHLKALVAQAQLLVTKEELTRVDKIILKMNDLLTNSNSHYFGPEAKLFISSQFISLADVVRIMASRGEQISRSGCENRILLNAKKFINDFGVDTAQILISDNLTNNNLVKLDAIELQLLKLEKGIDYTNNVIDDLLRTFNIKTAGLQGFEGQNVTPEQINKFLALIEPYTPKGKAKRERELAELNNVLWYFRKALLDGSDNATINYILHSL